ncbi:Uu.00g124180.m01.CDS01 [Anthostomella pinea]|uniref:Uu.00g124180.m01.CDS01 n=1 Tax=Anthostomella pinea TaxID=933095 RepID=A0AAI8YHK1_9PEZI|nr:Uu.00g124180.m01.CDS01 [Anthostomella pinea]
MSSFGLPNAPQEANLNHVLIQIPSRESRSDRGRTSSIRVSSDFDYDEFRKWVEVESAIPPGRPLVGPLVGPSRPDIIRMVDIDSTSSFWIALTQIQRGSVPLTINPQTGLPTLPLEAANEFSMNEGEGDSESAPQREESTTSSRASGNLGDPGASEPSDPDNIFIDSSSPAGPGRTPRPLEGLGRNSEVTDSPGSRSGLGDDLSGLINPLDFPSQAPSTPNRQRPSPQGSPLPNNTNSSRKSATTPAGKIASSAGDDSPARNDPQEAEEEAAAPQAGLSEDESSVSEDSVLQQMNLDYNTVDDDTWREVCKFFNCAPEAEKVKLDGILLSLEPYQMYAVYLTLRQVTRKIASFMIGDDVGFDKTGMSICVLILFRIIHVKYEEVLGEWDTKRTLHPVVAREHLGKGRQGKDVACPSQRPRGILCPCVVSGPSHQIAMTLPSLPSIVVCPPDLLPNWVSEFGSPSRGMQISGSHTSYDKSDYAHSLFVTDLTKAKIDWIHAHDNNPNAAPKPTYDLVPRDTRGSQRVILVSRLGTESLRAKYVKKNATYAGPDDGKLRSKNMDMSQLAAAFVFFDEFHGYRGGKDSLTEPFRFLKKIAWDSKYPTVAVGLSGSLRSNPLFWRPFVEHAFNVAANQEWVMDLAGLKRVSDLDQYQTTWRYLLDHFNTQDSKKSGDYDNRHDSLEAFLEKFIPIMMQDRKKDSFFRGVPIFKSAPVIELKHDMYKGAVYNAFRELDKIEQWQKDGQRGEAPERGAVERRLLDRAASAPGAPGGNSSFSIIMHASCFPAVARLVSSDTVAYEQMLVDKLGPLSKQISDLLSSVLRGQKANQRDDLALLEQSPCVTANDDRVAALGPPPPDGSNARHVLVFSDSPLSTFLTFMCLYQRFSKENVEFIYAHGGQKNRGDLCGYMNKVCKPNAPMKTFLGTFINGGEGHNMQRASHVILSEVPGSVEKQTQAFGRVDRKGQEMKPVLIQLYDTRNLAETVRRIRNRNRNRFKLGKIGHNDEEYQLANFL